MVKKTLLSCLLFSTLLYNSYSLEISNEITYDSYHASIQSTPNNTVSQNNQIPEEDKQSLIHIATEKNDIKEVKRLIDQGVDLKTRDPKSSGYRPISKACAQNNIELVKLFLEKDASLASDSYICSPIYLAYKNRNLELFDLIIKFNPNAKEELARALSVLSLETYFLSSQGKDILFFIHIGVDVNYLPNQHPFNDGLGAIHLAASLGDNDKVRILIENGADINLPVVISKERQKRQERPETALDFALRSNHSDIAEMLLQSGFQLDKQTQLYNSNSFTQN